MFQQQKPVIEPLSSIKKVKNTTLDIKKAWSLKQDWYLMTIRSRKGYDIKAG